MTWLSRSWPPAELSSTVAFMTPTKSLGGPTNVLSRSPPVSTQPARPREVPSDSSVPSSRPSIVTVSLPESLLSHMPRGRGSFTYFFGSQLRQAPETCAQQTSRRAPASCLLVARGHECPHYREAPKAGAR